MMPTGLVKDAALMMREMRDAGAWNVVQDQGRLRVSWHAVRGDRRRNCQRSGTAAEHRGRFAATAWQTRTWIPHGPARGEPVKWVFACAVAANFFSEEYHER